jgi:CheY-like chemotaxis protein
MTNPKKILIIDDDPDYIAGIKPILERADYTVEVAHNPKEGFNLFQARPFDLLLLDVNMGRGAEGVAVARKIRKNPKYNAIPILIITGIREQLAFLFPHESVQPQFADLDGLLEKPIEPKVLLEKVSTLLKLFEEKKNI